MDPAREKKQQSIVEIARYLDPEEALCARGFLESAGCPVVLTGEHHLSVEPYLRVALGGYRLLVPIDEAAVASRLLAEPEAGTEADEGGQDAALRRPHRNWVWIATFFLTPFLFGALPGDPFVPFLKGPVRIALQAGVLAFFYVCLWFILEPYFRA